MKAKWRSYAQLSLCGQNIIINNNSSAKSQDNDAASWQRHFLAIKEHVFGRTQKPHDSPHKQNAPTCF